MKTPVLSREQRGILLPLAGGLVCLITWVYAVGLYVPSIHNGLPQGPYASDLYPAWLATRLSLTRGVDPYSVAATQEIQQGFFGQAMPRDSPLSDAEAFVYPLYTVFLLAGPALLPFDVVRPLWSGGILLLLALSVLGWLRALDWRLQGRQQALIVLLGISSIPALNTFLLQQPTALVAALLAGAGAMLAARRLTLAGALLALATIKPQLCQVLIAWLLLWALSEWHTRRGLVIGFGATLAGLLAGAFLVQPGWLGSWLGVLTTYSEYATTGGGLPAPLRWGLLGVGGAGLIGFLWRTRRTTPGSVAFSLGLALCSLYSILLFPSWVAYNQVILVPAALLLVQQRQTLRAFSRLGALLYLLAVDTLLWPWLAATGLTVVALLAGVGTVITVLALPWITSLILPLVLLAALGPLAWQVARTPPAAALTKG